VNTDDAIDLVTMAIHLGATFVARSFSGDKKQLVPLIKAAIDHKGPAFIDCISPCVAFNNHDGSTKSFDYVRAHNEAVNSLDFITERAPIMADYDPGQTQQVKLHDGTSILLRKMNADYDIHDRVAAINYLMKHDVAGEIPTGLVYLEDEPGDMHDRLNTVDRPLNELTDADLVPGSAALAKINAGLR
ncbi:MAG: 2-oxoacid:ferredoxin oxidoreductase subunit beta, partial [Hyphomicrobiales bacterium]|nr:2-oxoacid:ferredoxin oxidoreductase subunit beta [Hyphomicrobiales bacterium]